MKQILSFWVAVFMLCGISAFAEETGTNNEFTLVQSQVIHGWEMDTAWWANWGGITTSAGTANGAVPVTNGHLIGTFPASATNWYINQPNAVAGLRCEDISYAELSLSTGQALESISFNFAGDKKLSGPAVAAGDGQKIIRIENRDEAGEPVFTGVPETLQFQFMPVDRSLGTNIDIDYIRFYKTDNIRSAKETDAYATFDFDVNIPSDGWALKGEVRGAYIAEGKIGAEVFGTACAETAGKFSRRAEQLSGIAVTYQNGTSSERAKLYFKTVEDEDWMEEHSAECSVVPNDTQMREYVFDTYKLEGWSGELAGLRLVLADSGGSIAVDRIRLLKFPAEINLSEGIFTVTGSAADFAAQTLSVKVIDTADGSIALEEVCVVGADGSFSFMFEGEDSGRVVRYDIGFETDEGCRFARNYTFVGEQFLEKLLERINGAIAKGEAGNALNLLNENLEYVHLDSEHFAIFTEENRYMEYFRQVFAHSKAFADMQQLSKRLDECVVLTWMCNADAEYEKECTPLLSLLEECGEMKLYQALSSDDKAKCISKVAKKIPTSYQEFADCFCEQAILTTINQTSGWKTIGDVIEQYAEKIGIDRGDIEHLKNRQSVYLKMVGCGSREGLTSYEQLKSEFYAAERVVNSSGNSGGSTGGSSGNTGGGKGGGGAYSSNASVTPKTNSPIGYQAEPVSEKPRKETAFRDMKGYEWAAESVENLRLSGVIAGRSAEKFEPGDLVLREEFCKMLVLALKVKIEPRTTTFSDVDPDAWYQPYVAAAVSSGYAKGIGEGRFGIGTAVTREDVAVMICRTIDGILEPAAAEISFYDRDEISDYAENAVAALTNAGLMKGMGNGMFCPKNNLTRAEAAVSIDRMLKYMDSIAGEGGNK